MSYELTMASPNELEQTVEIEFLADGSRRKTIKNNVAVLFEECGHKYKIMIDGRIKKDEEFIFGLEAQKIYERITGVKASLTCFENHDTGRIADDDDDDPYI